MEHANSRQHPHPLPHSEPSPSECLFKAAEILRAEAVSAMIEGRPQASETLWRRALALEIDARKVTS